MLDTQKGFTLFVFRSDLGDSTNGGQSSKTDMLRVIDNTDGEVGLPGIVDTEGHEDVTMQLIIRDVGFARFPIIAPMDYDSGKHYMFGGNFAWTSDSRLTGGPIKIFDRHEG